MEILVKTFTRHRDPLSKYWMKDWTGNDIVSIMPDGFYTGNKHNGSKTMGIVLKVDGDLPEDYHLNKPTEFKDYPIEQYGRSKYIIDLPSILTNAQMKDCYNHDVLMAPLSVKQSYLDLFKTRDQRTVLSTYDKSGTFDNETVDVGPGGHADANTFLEFESNVAISAGGVIGLADEDFDETAAITVSGTGAAAGKAITFRCTGAGKHDGKEDATAARLILTSNFAYIFTISDSHVDVDGLQIINETTGNGGGIIASHGGICNISNSIIRSAISSGGARYLVAVIPGANATTNIWNNILYDGRDGIRFSFGNSGQTIAVYNNTVVNCVGAGIQITDSAGDVSAYVKNNICFNNNDDYYLTNFTTKNYTNNCGEDDDTGSQDNYVVTAQAGTSLFTDYAGKDFSVKDASSDLDAAGADLDTDPDGKINVTTDAIGVSRHATTPSIGALEFVSGGGVTLVINPLTQSQSIDNIGIVQQNILVIIGMTQAQALDNLDLIQANILVISGIDQSQTIDNLDLIQANVIVINGLEQGQALDNLDLIQANVLDINGLEQGQALDNLDLQTGIALQIGGISQAQTIENIDLVQQSTLSIQGIDQAQGIDNITLSTGTILQIAKIVQDQNIESLNFIQQNILDIAGIDQAQTLEQITLDTGILLQIAGIIQNQTLENLDLTQQHNLVIDKLLQNQIIDNVVFSLFEGKVIITLMLKAASMDFELEKSTINLELKKSTINLEIE